jgi:hypothetical protein
MQQLGMLHAGVWAQKVVGCNYFMSMQTGSDDGEQLAGDVL